MTTAEPISEDAAKRLNDYYDRIENLREQITDLKSDEKDIFAEAKSNGFDVKMMRRILKDRKKKAEELELEDEMLDTYRKAAGLIPEFEKISDETA